MALIIKDRVKEITTTTGTGAVSLGGSSATFDAFQSVMSNGDTTFYAIVHTASGTDEWEVGLGTWNTGNTLTRTTVYAGSNGTSAVNFSSGNKDIFMTYPASKAAVAGEDVTFADVTATDITSTGTVTLSGDPSSSLQAATKQYVDTIAAAGIHYHTPVRVEHPSNLNATYNNGSSGVGATLTNAGTNAALVLDNVSMVLNDRVLVANQTDQTQNGVYTVTTVGDGSTAWVLTRSTDTDTAGPSDPDAFGKGDAFFIKEGDTNAGHLDVLTTTGTIVFGTTNIVFSEVAETSIYSAGTGLTLTGTTFSTNQDISTSASPTFAGATFTGNVDLGDDDYIRLGASQDLQIYHNASHSVIKDAGTGNLNLLADNFRIANAGWSKWYFTADNGGAATIFWNGAGRLATSSAGVDVTGNITVSGTVDGRDVATDGTKLDGIESGATGDQTASEILTAIKTVDGAASGLDADLLDGQQGSYYLNTSTTFSGDVSGTYNAIVVANDSHTHDGRYYTETEADSRFVNVTGDTMSGQLVVDDGNANPLELKRSSQVGIEFNDTSVGSRYLGVNGGNLWFGSNLNHGINQRVFTDAYHPNADKWTTARTLTLSGDASGSVSWDGSANATLSVTVANDSHTHDGRYYTESEADSRFANVTGDTFSGHVNVTYNTNSTGSSAPSYGSANIELQTSNNYTPAISFHRGGYSAGVLYEYDGQIYSKAWTTRSQDGLLLSTGNIGSYAWTSSNDGSGSGLDADMLDGYHVSTTRNATNSVPVRDGNGYLQLGWINTTSGSTTSTINKIYASYDNYIRYITPATFRSQVTDGSYVNVTGDTMTGTLTLSQDGQDVINFSANDTNDARGIAFNNRTALSADYNDGYLRLNQLSEFSNGVYSPGRIRADGGFTVGNNTTYVWHQGNDGSGSGLDADLLDGLHASSFARKDSGVPDFQYGIQSGDLYLGTDGDTDGDYNVTLKTRVATDYLYLQAGGTSGVNINPSNNEKLILSGSSSPYLRFQENTTNRAYIQYDSSRNSLKFQNQEAGVYDIYGATGAYNVNIRLCGPDGDVWGSLYAEETSTVYGNIGFLDDDGSWAYKINADLYQYWYLNGVEKMYLGSTGLVVNDNIYVAGGVYHKGDTDTYLSFGTNTITLATGGSSEITIDTTGVRLGDTGNAYVQPVSGNYGSFQIDGGAHGGWEGYSIGGRVVFMHNNGSEAGIYNDVNNHWMVRTYLAGAVQLMYNSSVKLATSNTGVTVTGTVAATSFSGDGSNLTGIDAGATGGGSDAIFWENDQTVTTNYTITNGQNAMSAGPITINSGVTVTIGTGEAWTVV